MAQEKVEAIVKDPDALTNQTRAMEKAGDAMAEAKEVKQEAKLDLLEEVTRLREERVLLLDNMRVAVDELEAKTDKDDTETFARIKDYRLYMRNVSGITIDVSDTTSVWAAISGWINSREGGIRWLLNIATFCGILLFTGLVASLVSRAVRRVGARLAWPTLLSDFLYRILRGIVWIAGSVFTGNQHCTPVGPGRRRRFHHCLCHAGLTVELRQRPDDPHVSTFRRGRRGGRRRGVGKS